MSSVLCVYNRCTFHRPSIFVTWLLVTRCTQMTVPTYKIVKVMSELVGEGGGGGRYSDIFSSDNCSCKGSGLQLHYYRHSTVIRLHLRTREADKIRLLGLH